MNTTFDWAFISVLLGCNNPGSFADSNVEESPEGQEAGEAEER